jgi:alpha-1,6-mannosyltransferase
MTMSTSYSLVTAAADWWRRLSARGGELLAALGGLSALGYWLVAARLSSAGGAGVYPFLGLFGLLFLLYAAAAWCCRTLEDKKVRRAMLQVFAWAIVFRSILLFAGLPQGELLSGAMADLSSGRVAYRPFLLYDNDVWRYLWDGHVASGGFNPYLHSPAELEELAVEGEPWAAKLLESGLWQDIFDRVAYQELLTVYPPAAQLLFRLLHTLAPGSVLAWKLVLALLDLGTCWLLWRILRHLRRPPLEVILYAWNPLVIKEFAGSGHVDALMVFLLTGAVWLLLTGRRLGALAAWSLSVLSKLVPLVLVGLLARRTRPRQWTLAVALLALGYLPLVQALPSVAEGLVTYARGWVFNPGLWALVRWVGEDLSPGTGPAVAGAVWMVGCLATWASILVKDRGSDEELVRYGFLLLAVFLLLNATVMPWYVLWALPLAVVARSRAWIAFSALSMLSYLVYVAEAEHGWWLLLEHASVWTLLAHDLWRWEKRGPLR